MPGRSTASRPNRRIRVNDYQFVAYEAGHKRLQIQLAQPLAPERSIRLAVRAHRTPSSWLAAEDFRPVEFLDVAQASRLVAIAPDASYRLDLVGDDGLDRVDPDSLSPAEAGRLLPRRGGVVFVDNDQADRLTINVTREDPEFAAAVQVDADCGSEHACRNLPSRVHSRIHSRSASYGSTCPRRVPRR